MQDNAITACYSWTADEYAASYETHVRAASGRQQPSRVAAFLNSRGFLIAVFVPLWILLLLISLRDPNFDAVRMAVLGVLAVAGFLFILTRGRRSSADSIDSRAAFGQRKDHNQQVRYRFTAEGMEIATDAGAASAGWETITSVVRGPKGFLFYRNPTTYHWLPLHALSAEDAGALEEMVQGRVGKYSAV